MPITYESENYIKSGSYEWDGHFEKVSKTMYETYNLYIVELDGLYGILGDNGETLYPPQFEGLYALNLKNEEKRPRFLVNIKDKWGEILADGSIAEEIKYDGIWYAPDKKSKILKEGDNWQLKSLDGNRLLKQFTTTQLPDLYAGGLIPVINTSLTSLNQNSGNYSLAGDGNVYVWGEAKEKGVASIKYEMAKKGEITERLFKMNGKWFITSNFGTKDMKTEPMPATFVIPVLREKKWGAINQEGKTVIPFEHSYIKSSGNQFETDKGLYKTDGTLVSKNETAPKNAKKEYHNNGNLKSIGAYDANGSRVGEWKHYNENGKLTIKGSYQGGQEIGEWEYYNDKGVIYAKKIYPEEMIIFYYESGRVQAEGYEKNNKYEGKWKEYYDNENHNLEREGEFANGKPTGSWKFYYENGQLKKKHNGKGDWVFYYENGAMNATGSFDENSKQTGEWKVYYENGTLKETGKYNNGEKTGKWHQYDENGNEI